LLLSNRTRLNDLLLFIGVIGGLEAFGLLGLVAGPTIVARCYGRLPVFTWIAMKAEPREPTPRNSVFTPRAK